jgi:hypothetical protein
VGLWAVGCCVRAVGMCVYVGVRLCVVGLWAVGCCVRAVGMCVCGREAVRCGSAGSCASAVNTDCVPSKKQCYVELSGTS